MAGKGPGEQEELQPCRKRLWPVSMPLGGAHKELGGWGAVAIVLWHRWGGPFAALPRWEMGLSLSLWSRWVTRATGLGWANAALARSCGPWGSQQLGSASQLHQPKKAWGGP